MSYVRQGWHKCDFCGKEFAVSNSPTAGSMIYYGMGDNTAGKEACSNCHSAAIKYMNSSKDIKETTVKPTTTKSSYVRIKDLRIGETYNYRASIVVYLGVVNVEHEFEQSYYESALDEDVSYMNTKVTKAYIFRKPNGQMISISAKKIKDYLK